MKNEVIEMIAKAREIDGFENLKRGIRTRAESIYYLCCICYNHIYSHVCNKPGARKEQQMTLDKLYDILELPAEVCNTIAEYKKSHTGILTPVLQEQLEKRGFWEQAIEEMKRRIGEDPFGFYILSELLDYARQTYHKYKKKGIDDDIFVHTMQFCTRFLNEHKRIYGYYAFTWAWWFPRQLSLQEFRIGELEYEFVDAEEKRIYIHIPGDAHMEAKRMQESFTAYRNFLTRYYPDWVKVDWYCESWMLSPSLKELLPEDSNILGFQKLFEIESTDYESMAVLDWVYPGEKTDLSGLSENTSLQKNMKHFLLAGGKIGWANGKYSANPIF